MATLEGGYDTCRPSDADGTRTARQATARRNLAAMVCTTHGVDFDRDTAAHPNVAAAAAEFRELADALGLNGPPPAVPVPAGPPPCGTDAAYHRHRRHNERVDDVCRKAHYDAEKKRKAVRGEAVEEQGWQ